jgi:hypothetical protein
MRNGFVCIAMAVAVLCCASSAQADAVLAYSFEAPPVNPDGFGPNGGGVTVAQEGDIGVTHGDNSLRMSVVQGATFVGALTPVVHPSIGDPPGVDHILFDMTIDPAGGFPGSFAVVGVTIFAAGLSGWSAIRPSSTVRRFRTHRRQGGWVNAHRANRPRFRDASADVCWRSVI